MAFCEQCGRTLEEGSKFCENCGAPITTESPVSRIEEPPEPDNTIPNHPSPAYQAKQASVSPSGEKNPALAAVASLFVSGLGQTYNGNLLKGLAVFFGTLVGSLLFTIPGLIVLCYGIYDAYTTAKKMNEGTIPNIPHSFLTIGVHTGVIILILIIAVSVAEL